MYAIAKDKPFFCTIMLLHLFLWYPLNNGKTYNTIFFCCSGLLRLISVVSGLGTLIHVVFAIKYDIDIDVSEDIGDLTGFVGCMALCLKFLYHHARWSNLFNNLLDFKHFGKPPNYDKIVKRCNLVCLACLLYTVPGMLWYLFVSHLQVPECIENNAKKGLNEPCGMVNPTWMPVKQMEGMQFWICYVFQIVGIFVYLPSAFATCIIAWEAVEVIVTRIEQLKKLFREVFQSDDRKLCMERLQFCISYHQDIINISDELNELVRSTSGSFFFTAAIVIGSLGSQLLNQQIPKATSYVLGYILGLFFLCHAGQRLIDESLDLTNFIYDSRWYEMDAKIKKDLVFVLARCQKPLRLSAPASMGSAGYILFCIMIKTSYSYLTLLNQMV